MAFYSRAAFDTLRVLNYTGISASYAAVGIPLAHPVRIVCITNNTNGDLFLSDDGVNAKLFLKSGSFKLFDVNQNRDGGPNEQLKLPVAIQFYTKQSTAPSSGDLYIECVYAQGE